MNNPENSNIAILQDFDDPYQGWTSTNEDHLLLLEGLKGIHRPGGFFAVGEFQVLDIALELGADVIVLGDLDLRAVKKNIEVLKIIETTAIVSEVLPKLFKLLEELDGIERVAELKLKLTLQGASTASRVRLSWTYSQETLDRLRELISQGKIAVAQVDITKPQSMSVVGRFFAQHNTRLEAAYLSNTISHAHFDDKRLIEHQSAVQSLYAAGGYENTLLIRSGLSTDEKVISELFAAGGQNVSPDAIKKMADEAQQETSAHYGPNTQRINEVIRRAFTGSWMEYDFEFFTQNLGAYQKHADEL